MISNQAPSTVIYGIVNGSIVPVGTLTVSAGGQLILTPSGGSSGGGGGGGGSGHFDPSGNLRVYDPTNNGWWTLTAPGGVLGLTNFSTTP